MLLSRGRGRGTGDGRFFGGLTGREYGFPALADRPFVNDFDCRAGVGSGCIPVAPHGTRTPAFSLKFSNHAHGSKLLAVADEEGYIHVVDAEMTIGDDRSGGYAFEGFREGRPWLRHTWQAHYNAVFDVMWTQDDQHLLTASGDQTLGVWDVEAHLQTHCLRGHSGSVKSMSQSLTCTSVFASGGRDGAVLLWDARVGGGGSGPVGPVHRIEGAHIVKELHRRRGRRPGVQGDSKQSVTSVMFLRADEVLATAGAADGVVKFWDARNLAKPVALVGLCKDTAEGGGRGGAPGALARRHGITCMDEDPTGGRLLVSHSNSSICIYDVLRPEQGPVKRLTGHRTSSFYVKAAFSPDGSHVVSGSSDRRVCLWGVDRPDDAPYGLEAHTGEVTGVAWCPQDFGQIATCADDATVRLWRIRRPEEPRPLHRAGRHGAGYPGARLQADPPPGYSGGTGENGGAPGTREGGELGPSTAASVAAAGTVGEGARGGAGDGLEPSGEGSEAGEEGGEGGPEGGAALGKRKRTLKDYYARP